MTSPSRSFPVKTDEASNTIDIQISELAGIKAENLGLATWGAAVVLADILHRWTHNIKTTFPKNEATHNNEKLDPSKEIQILELGAGTGLAGLAASALWTLPTILTDLPSILPGIEANVTLNNPLFTKLGTSAFSGSLDWTSPSTLHIPSQDLFIPSSSSKANIILAADTCYTSSHGQLISQTVEAWLAHKPEARAIFCYPLRMAYINHARNLWEQMEGRGFVCIEEGRERAAELWGEVEPAPYEWSVWSWAEFHPEAVAAAEAAKEADSWIPM